LNVLTLAFDTATATATSALVRDGVVLGERASRPARVLADADDLLRAAEAKPADLDRIVLGTGPGSFTGLRMGLAAGRALGLALDVSAAGVSTLDALAAGSPGAVPVIDARRNEVFTLCDGRPVVLAPAGLELEPGTRCVGDGAVRYRSLLEELGAQIPPHGSELHVPRARFHALLARDFGDADLIEPLYLRIPDAERAIA
jgi:tRNA threonylcarbamoyladenosine biosynthesis protein TsaB